MINNETGSIKKIAIVGPESTGKTELARFLAAYFNTCWVEECARAYLVQLAKPYQESDLVEIARLQAMAEDKLMAKANRILICDTNTIVIKIWSMIKYGQCNKKILEIIQSRFYDLHLLTYIDIPWIADPQREHPHRIAELWWAYKKELRQQNVPYIEIRGEYKKRQETAIQTITDLIKP